MTDRVRIVSQDPVDLAYRALTGKDVVSEGGLEPPCPQRALAPQASASAYSATRTCAAATVSAGRLTIANVADPRRSARRPAPAAGRPARPRRRPAGRALTAGPGAS